MSKARPSQTTTLRGVEGVLAEQLPSAWTARLERGAAWEAVTDREEIERWDALGF